MRGLSSLLEVGSRIMTAMSLSDLRQINRHFLSGTQY
jgi:hypothetical protein